MKRIDTVKMDGLEMTEQELDRRLNSEGHLQIQQVLRQMPEESVNMSWRSELNEKLISTIQTKQRKRRFAWILSPALGLGLAGALAVVVMFKTPTISDNPVGNPQPQAGESLEQSLVAAHGDSIRITDVTGVGLNSDEMVNNRTASDGYDFSEVDLGSL